MLTSDYGLEQESNLELEEKNNLGQTFTVADLIEGKDYDEKVKIKGEELSKLTFASSETTDDYKIEVIEINKRDDGVEILARVYHKNNKQIGFGEDGTVDIERFIFVNPPIMVPDGTTRQVWSTSSQEFLTVDNLELNPKQALLDSLNHTISVKSQKSDGSKIIKDKVGNTTSTIYPYNDGEINYNATVIVWSNVRDATDGTEVFETINDNITLDNTPGVRREVNLSYDLFRAFAIFDTSSIGDDTISSAVVSFYNSAESHGDDDAQAYLAITSFSPANRADVTTADYDQFTDTKWSDDQSLNGMSTSAYVDYTFDATGISNIDGSGYTDMMLREGHDIEDTAIANSSNNRGQTNFSDQSGTSKDPKFVIEHAAAAADEPVYQDIIWIQ